MHVDLSLKDESVLEQLSDVLSGVGESDLGGFIGVDPHSLLSALKDGGSESLLESEECHN